MITVKAAQPDSKEPYKVILWEKSPQHASRGNDEGEIFISADDKEYRVGETAAVKRLLMEGTLVKAESKAAAKKDEPKSDAAKKDDVKPAVNWNS